MSPPSRPPDRWRGFPRPEPRRPPPPGGLAAPTGSKRGSKGFASTWWGAAWIEALENRARLDPNRLPRGRSYARQGHVLSLELASGAITARVAGSRSTPYVVKIKVRTFTATEWDRAFDAIASRAAHAAALLDGDLEPGVVDDALDAGVDLLPGPGDLQPRCSCPDWADPCKHAAAVCYLVAPRLDADPFLLFALRGKGRDELLAAVRSRRTGGTARPEGAGEPGDDDGSAPTWERDRGVVARDAWARSDVPALPPGPPAGARPGRPAPWPVDPPSSAPFDAIGLRALAADAARRAWRMGHEGEPSGLALDPEADLARRAADALDTDEWPDLVARAGEPGAELARRAVAWRQAGTEGLSAADEEAWTPDAMTMAAARDVLVGLGAPTRSVRVAQNRVTVAPWRAQLRLARDGRWWGFAKRGNRWDLATSGHDEVDDAADALVTAVDN